MYKTKLQEICHERLWSLPSYTTSRDGPDHNPKFRASVVVNGVTFDSPDFNKSAKEAQNEAAKTAVNHLITTSSPVNQSRVPLQSAVQSLPPWPPSSPGSSSASNVLGNSPSGQEKYPIRGNASDVRDDKEFADVPYIYKNQLQAYAQKRNLNLPFYSCVREGSPHSLRFKATVTVDGQTFESPMFFRTLKEAEHAAAKAALCSLSNDDFQKDDCSLYKNLLQDLTGKEGFSTPVYTTRSSGASHVPTFTATVEVEGDVFHGVAAKTKKQAEINAAKIAYFSLKERQLSRVPAALVLNGDAKEALECIYPNFVSSLTMDLQKNLNLEDTDVDHGAAPEELLSNRGTSKISHSTSQLKPETGTKAGTSRSSSSDNVSEPLHVPVPRVPSSKDGSSSPTTVLECSNLAVAEPTTDKTAKECVLLCNRVVIYPRKQGWSLPKGASMLPISDDKWVAVSLDYPS